MTRRANGEGTFCKRGRGFYGRVWAFDPATGSSRRLSVRGRSLEEVRIKARKIREIVMAGSDSSITVGEWLGYWLDTYKSASRSNTRQTYGCVIRKNILPHLGSIRLSSLGPDHVSAMVSRVSHLKPATIQLVQNTLRSALSQALKSRKVAVNIMNQIASVTVVRKDHLVFNHGQFARFRAAVENSPFRVIYLLLIGAGLRIGEALALRWEDVSPNLGSITVRQTAVRDRGGMIINPPKTKLSMRTIVIPGWLSEALRETPARDRSGLVASNRRGGILHPTQVRKDFLRLLESAQLPRVTIHGLRHMHASILLQSGTDIFEVSRRLGHSSITTTSDIYGHLTPGTTGTAAANLDRLWSKDPALSEERRSA